MRSKAEGERRKADVTAQSALGAGFSFCFSLFAFRLRVVAAIVAVLAAATATAADYPQRPIRMMIPQPAGGTMDTIARAVSNIAVESVGYNVVIDNRSGANGIIAGETLARAAPDGYTLLYTSASLANNELVMKKPQFQVLKDFAPVTQVTLLPGYLILTNNQTPAKSLKELLELSKRQPVHFGSSGQGNSQHLLGELINARTGSKMVHVPYKGFALIVNAVMGNEIQVLFGAPTTTVQHIKAGRLRALAYTGAKRWSGMPDLPTVSEAGIKGMVYEASWHGIFAPAGTPRPVLMKIRDEYRKAVHSPRLTQFFVESGHIAIGSTPEEFRKFVDAYLKATAEELRIAKVERQ
jgi:tripartite-type tricarboxylate transporter receptor subunit TctC